MLVLMKLPATIAILRQCMRIIDNRNQDSFKIAKIRRNTELRIKTDVKLSNLV